MSDTIELAQRLLAENRRLHEALVAHNDSRERAAVVRYLRAQGFAHDHSPNVWDLIDAIERGEHLKDPTT
jgi:hypothetical protein